MVSLSVSLTPLTIPQHNRKNKNQVDDGYLLQHLEMDASAPGLSSPSSFDEMPVDCSSDTGDSFPVTPVDAVQQPCLRVDETSEAQLFPTSQKPSARGLGIRRVVSSFLRRKPLQVTTRAHHGMDSTENSEHILVRASEVRFDDRHMWAQSKSPRELSSPSSPRSPMAFSLGQTSEEEEAVLSSGDEIFSEPVSCGQLPEKRSKISFGPAEADARKKNVRLGRRHPSKHLVSASVRDMPRQSWGMVAAEGTGLKSRRLSISDPENLEVYIVDLNSEFTEQSKSRILGRYGKCIGTGATATISLVKRIDNPSEICAVKMFRRRSSRESRAEYEYKIKSEFSIAKSLFHPNIVESFRLCTHQGSWYHVMEYCEQGDLYDLVHSKFLSGDSRLSDRLCLFKQLIQGLNYLHANGIAHRDIKLENLLVTSEGKLKIADFGVSEVFSGLHPGIRSAGGACGKKMDEIRLSSPGVCGSPPYIAPEVLQRKEKYDPRPLDVWSAGIVMLSMCANGQAWAEAKPGKSENRQYDSLVEGWDKWNAEHDNNECSAITESDYPRVLFFDNFIKPPVLRRMLLTMLNPDPIKRINIPGILNNRWFKTIQCCQIDGYDEAENQNNSSSQAMYCLENAIAHSHVPPQAHTSRRFLKFTSSFDT